MKENHAEHADTELRVSECDYILTEGEEEAKSELHEKDEQKDDEQKDEQEEEEIELTPTHAEEKGRNDEDGADAAARKYEGWERMDTEFEEETPETVVRCWDDCCEEEKEESNTSEEKSLKTRGGKEERGAGTGREFELVIGETV